MAEIQRGAVAMIDALGIRGAWGADPTTPKLDAFKTLEAVRVAVDKEVSHLRKVVIPRLFPEAFRGLISAPKFQSLFLSDTLVICASVSPRKRAPRKSFELKTAAATGLDFRSREQALDAFMRYLVCECVCSAIQAAAQAARPVAYRGVVSVGHFSIEGNFMLGPAIDEAAGLMELADGSFVWLAPSAQNLDHVLRPREHDRWDDLVIQQDVPLKDGRSLRTMVINPFAGLRAEAAKKMGRELIKSMDSRRLDVVLKRQNTERFFARLASIERMVARRKKLEDARPKAASYPEK